MLIRACALTRTLARPASFAFRRPSLVTGHLWRSSYHTSLGRQIDPQSLSLTSSQMSPTRSVPPMAPFPTNGLLPKETTQALSFLKKYPEYDGRNVRVGILDTGVDPAAIGLNGPGKMVDVIDCTGSGDIALTEVKPVSTDSSGVKIVSPTTGRTLILSSQLKNPTGSWLLGARAAYAIFPDDLVGRRRAERKKEFDVEHGRLVAKAQQELFILEQATDEQIKATKAQKKEELNNKISALNDLAKSYKDPGPIIETVVFHDGTHYRAIVGGAEGAFHDPSKGLPHDQIQLLKDTTVDLTKAPALTDFRFEKQHAEFGEADMLTYSVNILTDDADVQQAFDAPKGKAVGLSLVVVSGSHGTHVAGIVGSHRTDDEEQNGVARGCEIVSLKIGDTRVKSMETQQALLRAAQALVATKCDIANMSFGEAGAFGVENKGLFAQILRDFVIRQRDILFISSAGNAGPALTTVGQPGGTTSAILSIGAYVDAGAMQQAEYALVEKNVPSSATTWCSRGPTVDGAKGVDVYAPGAAITSIPRYCLSATMLANGTSMSSPNACGSIALLLSGMKKEGIPITAARVYKAIRATAKDVSDDLGVPFIQVDKAWDYLVEHRDKPDQDAEFRVAVTPAGKVPGKVTDQRGIYIREKNFTQKVNQFSVTIKPTYKSFGEPERAYDLQLPITLSATEPWVKTPDFLFLGGNGRTFEARVDATQLQPGLHTALIEGYDSNTPGRKLFDVPVTVAKPLVPQGPTVNFKSVRLATGSVDRRFIHVPEGATWAELRFRTSNHEVSGTSVRCWVHAVQLEPQQRLGNVEGAYVMAMNEGEPVTKKMTVKAGMTLELVLSQFFTNAAGFDLDVDVEFHGITVSHLLTGRDELTIVGGDGIVRLECISNLRIEDLKPSVTFDQRRTFVRPTSSEIVPLTSARDRLPSGNNTAELILTYPIDLKEEANNLTLSLPLSDHLYDSDVPMLTQLYDVNKKRVQFGDVYPKTLEKLPKGAYTLQVQLLQQSIAVLEKLKNMTLRVDQKLSKPVESVNLYPDIVDQFGPGKTFKEQGQVKLHPGERKVLCMDTNLEGEALPKEAQPGDLLLGSLSFAAEGKTTLRYLVPPAPKKAPTDEGKKPDPTVAELLTGLVSKVAEADKKSFLAKLVKEYPDDLGVLVARLESLKADDKEEASEVLTAADAVLKHSDVNEDRILIFVGSKKLPAAEQTTEQKEEARKMDERKKALVTALNRRARALLAQSEEKSTKDFEETFERYRKLIDASDKDFASVYSRWAIIHERYGTALQATRKLIKELGAGTPETVGELNKARQLERDLYAKLDWKLWSAISDKHRVLESASKYLSF